MKRIIPIALVLLFALTLTGCININLPPKPAQTEAPTEAPGFTPAPTEQATETPTEAPTEEPTEAPTDEPTPEPVTGWVDYIKELKLNYDNILDIDFDGLEDKLYIATEPGPDYEELTNYTVTLTLGADSSVKAFQKVYEYCDDMHVWVMDCDPTDSRLEIVLSYLYNGTDGFSTYIRLSEDGNSIRTEEAFLWVDADSAYSFTTEGGFPVFSQTDIFGTHTIAGQATVDRYGFSIVSDGFVYYYYDDPEYDLSVKLKKSLEVIIVDEDGNEVGSYTVSKGKYLTPYKTDAESYLILILPDGRFCRVSVEVHPWIDYGYEYGIFINGVNQDEYGDMPYAG